MATQIDARVKQKTGVEADFAGYVLLEGEIALVRTSANGPVWNFKVGPGDFASLDWSLQNPGAAVAADTSTVFPAGVPGLYIPTEDGNYDGVMVDLSVGYVQLIWDGTTLVKVEFPIDLAGYVSESELKFTDLPLKLLYDTNINITNNGLATPNSDFVGVDFVEVDPDFPMVMYRGANSGLSVACYDADQVYIGYLPGSAESKQTFTFASLPTTKYVRANVSSNPATREADIAAFRLVQPAIGLVEEIKGSGIMAEAIKDPAPFVMKESMQVRGASLTNIYSVGQCEDDTYVHSSGSIGTGASSPATDYVMARIPIDRSLGTKVSWRRSATPNTMGYFFDAQHHPISGIIGVGSASTGTDDIPEGATWLYVNVSNNPLSRARDKSRLTVVYGDTIPSDHLPQKSLTAVGSLLISHPYSGLKGIAIGDSITTYERVGVDGQNSLSNYFVRACAAMGATMLQNYSIGGSTISQRLADPTGRDPISIRYVDMRDDADFVMVSAGTNDCTHAWTPLGVFSDSTVNTFYGAMHVLCQGLKAKYVGKQVFFLTPIRRYAEFVGMIAPDSVNGNGEKPVEYADAIIEVCNYYGIPVFDRFRTCRLWPFMEDYRTLYMSDGTHPNADGHIIMADDLVNWLRQL